MMPVLLLPLLKRFVHVYTLAAKLHFFAATLPYMLATARHQLIGKGAVNGDSSMGLAQDRK